MNIYFPHYLSFLENVPRPTMKGIKKTVYGVTGLVNVVVICKLGRAAQAAYAQAGLSCLPTSATLASRLLPYARLDTLLDDSYKVEGCGGHIQRTLEVAFLTGASLMLSYALLRKCIRKKGPPVPARPSTPLVPHRPPQTVATAGDPPSAPAPSTPPPEPTAPPSAPSREWSAHLKGFWDALRKLPRGN